MMGSRIYVGKLPNDIRDTELHDVFGKYGNVVEITLKGNYAFIQFQNSLGAKDAVYELNNRTLFGDRVSVEHARTPKEIGGGGAMNYGGRDNFRDRDPPRGGRFDGGDGGRNNGRDYDRRGGAYGRGNGGGYNDNRSYERSYDKGFDLGYSGGRDRRRDRSPLRGGY